MSLRVKPFPKNEHGYPTTAADATIGYPVDHSIENGKRGAKPGHPAPEGGAPNQMPGKPGAGAK